MIGIGHVRSNDQQAQEGLSIGTQIERLKAWATTKGISLKGVVSDEGVSGINALQLWLHQYQSQCRCLNRSCVDRGVLEAAE